jgi:hypothetical protein
MLTILIYIVLTFYAISCLGFSNYKAAKDIKLISKERFLKSCQQYQSSELSATVDLEGAGLPSKTMSITSLVKFVSDRPDVASVADNVLFGNSIGKSTISIALNPSARGTILTTATVEVTDLPTYVESLSVAAVTGVELFAPGNRTKSSDIVIPTIGVRQDLHGVGDRANVSVYANFDDGTYMDVTRNANVDALSGMLNVTEDAMGPQVVVLSNEHVDNYLLLAEYQTCPGRVVTGVGRIVVTPRGSTVPSAVPSAAPLIVATNVSRVPTLAPTALPTLMPSPYESLGLPTSTPSLLATAAPTILPSALPTHFLSNYPSAGITHAPTGQPAMEPTSQPSAEPTARPSNRPSSRAPNGLPSSSPSTAPTVTPTSNAEVLRAPSGTPTSTPTVLPSMPPSLGNADVTETPTSSPSCSETAAASETASPFTYLVHPEIGIVSGSGFPLRAAPTLSGKSTWVLPFGLMTDQAVSSRTVGISVGGRIVGSQELPLRADPIASILVVPKARTVYADERVLAMAYQVRDAAGSTLVDGEVVQMVARNVHIGASMVIDCLFPEMPAGTGTCTGVLPAAWFVPTGWPLIVEAVVSVSGGVSADPVDISLVPAPQYAAAPPGVFVTIPSAPVFTGASFMVDISVNTGGRPLAAWNLALSYDSAVVEVESVVTVSTFSPASIVRALGTTKLSCRGLSASTTYGEVNGTAVALVSVRFVVRAGAAGRLYDELMRLTVVDLVWADDASQPMRASPPTSGLFRDRRQIGNYASGQLVVKRREYVGLLPYAVQTELVDTGALNGVAVLSPIVSLGVSNDPDVTSLTDLTAHSTCGSLDASVGGPYELPVMVSGCVVSTTKGCTIGAKSIPVPVSYAGSNSSEPLAAAVPFRVWCASTISVKVLDKVLNAIEI